MQSDKSYTRKKFSVFNVLMAVILVFYAITIIFSMYFIFANAVKDFAVFQRGNVFGIGGFTLDNITEVLISESKIDDGTGVSYISVFSALIDTVLYAVGGAFFAALMPCITAYFAAKYNYKFSKILYVTVIVVIIIPIIGNLPSTYRVLKSLNLYDSIIGMYICKANFVNMWLLVFYAAFQSVPNDSMEAAYIDGASEFRVIVKVMLPLVRNTFFTVMLIFFVDLWNDYMTPALFLPTHSTLAYMLKNYDLSNRGKVPLIMAACSVMLLPTLVIFVGFRNKLMGNLTMGGIKG